MDSEDVCGRSEVVPGSSKKTDSPATVEDDRPPTSLAQGAEPEPDVDAWGTGPRWLGAGPMYKDEGPRAHGDVQTQPGSVEDRIYRCGEKMLYVSQSAFPGRGLLSFPLRMPDRMRTPSRRSPPPSWSKSLRARSSRHLPKPLRNRLKQDEAWKNALPHGRIRSNLGRTRPKLKAVSTEVEVISAKSGFCLHKFGPCPPKSRGFFA